MAVAVRASLSLLEPERWYVVAKCEQEEQAAVLTAEFESAGAEVQVTRDLSGSWCIAALVRAEETEPVDQRKLLAAVS